MFAHSSPERLEKVDSEVNSHKHNSYPSCKCRSLIAALRLAAPCLRGGGGRGGGLSAVGSRGPGGVAGASPLGLSHT